MSIASKSQPVTLALALVAALLAAASFVGRADANRIIEPADRGMAFVDVFGLIDLIVKGDEFETERTQFDDEQQTQIASMQTRMQELQAQIQVADPNAPETSALYSEGQQLQQQMQQFYQQYQFGLEQLIGQQIARAYQRIYTAAREEAAVAGVQFLFASRPNDELMVDSLSGVAQEILARPLLAPPASVDLTEAVRVRLGLPEPGALDATDTQPGAIGQPEDQNADQTADQPADN